MSGKCHVYPRRGAMISEAWNYARGGRSKKKSPPTTLQVQSPPTDPETVFFNCLFWVPGRPRDAG